MATYGQPPKNSQAGAVTLVDASGNVISTLPVNVVSGAVTDHGALTGLADDDHTQYALLIGRATGQTIQGGTSASEVLTLESTSHATKGLIKSADGTLIVDEVNNQVGISIDPPTHQFHIELNPTDNFFIDGRTQPRLVTVGALRQEHSGGVPGTRAAHYDIDSNAFDDTRGVTIRHNLESSVTELRPKNLALEASVTGGQNYHLNMIEFDKVGDIHSSARIDALDVRAGISPIHHHSGTATTLDNAFKYDGVTFTDTTTAFNSGSNVTIFDADDDEIYIGQSAIFLDIECALSAVASKNVKPVVEYWNGSAWVVLAVSDGTDGFRESGDIQFADPGDWALTLVDGVNKFWIRIRRTNPAAMTVPTEQTIKTVTSIEYEWDLDGQVCLRNLIAVPMTTVARDALTPTDGMLVFNLTTDRYEAYYNAAWNGVAIASDVVTDHGALTGIADDDHTQYVAAAGRATGQTIQGGTVASENLTLESTKHVTKGAIIVSDPMGIGIAPDVNAQLHVYTGSSGATASANTKVIIEENDNTGITILTPNNRSGIIYFGDAEDNDIGSILYSHATDQFTFTSGAGNRLELAASEAVFNESGGDTDFRVEGDTDINLLFCDAGNDRVGIGTATPGSELDVIGWTTLGSGGPIVKMKKITGTAGGTEGDSTNIAHGLGAIGKILGVDVLITEIGGERIPPAYISVDEQEYDVFIDATNVVIKLSATNSGNLINGAITVLLTHEQ